MFLKNLLRRKIRTLLTVLGISIGVAAIIGLGSLANGLENGYQAMLTGSKADLIISQPDTFDISYSSIDEKIGEQLAAAPEVSEISGMLEGFTQTEDEPFFFVFGYPRESFVLGRFQIMDGIGLRDKELHKIHGKPIWLGSAAAEVLNKKPGDTLRLTGSSYRIAGIYQTGDVFEDSGAILELRDAQDLLGKPRQVSIYYIRLKDLALKQRFMVRFERLWSDLSLSGVKDFADKQALQDYILGFVWAIGGLAIIIGGVGMMNSQLMSVMERTREIGVLRAIGWSKWRVLWMILRESLAVCLLGGMLGIGLGWLLLMSLKMSTVVIGISSANLRPELIIQAFFIVIVLGLVGGLYPAWRASKMQPVEALRYEGGSIGKVKRLPFGGLAVQGLFQRLGRTTLTLTTIGITVGAIIALEGVMKGFTGSFEQTLLGTQNEIMIRQADVSDTSLSAIDERIGDKIAAMPEVKYVSGVIIAAVVLPDTGGFFIIEGYEPGSNSVQRFKIIEGKPLSSNHEIIIGKQMADLLKRRIGDSLDLSGVRFRIVGIYESKVSWEELGGVITLRDGQTFTGRPRKVTMYSVKLHDPSQANEMVTKVNRQFPEVYASLTGEFVQQMPDMQNSNGMLNGISFLAILIGGVGVLNTMLMAVFERTREIGVLRALGWQRKAILGLILKEALILGLLGGFVSIGIAFILAHLMQREPTLGAYLTPSWDWIIFLRAISIALLLGLLGGLYPAYRATRLQPIEALRYE